MRSPFVMFAMLGSHAAIAADSKVSLFKIVTVKDEIQRRRELFCPMDMWT